MGVTKDSLEKLKERVDLVEVISTYIPMKSAGASYKGCCPFHDEKTPSFVVKKGDSHYHCFGCGAHGDAIAFLMSHLSLSFQEAVEMLAERFGVLLEQAEKTEKGPDKKRMKEALQVACDLYHFILLHTDQGREALSYLYQRGIDLDFIRHFSIGLAPSDDTLFFAVMKEKQFPLPLLAEAGLLKKGGRPFFFDRITFPITDPAGAVIGFSARKYKETTGGGKYVNTPETPLFKKSHVLFGLSYSRTRIAKEKRALIVEGQIDALRLIECGLNFTVAGQGTAFTEEGAEALMKLGVTRVFLAMDGDQAGQEATVKVGHFFQKEGVEVRIVEIPPGADPDSLLREEGPDAFVKRMERAQDYLSFLIAFYSKTIDINTPSGKNQIAEKITRQIEQWEHPLMVHESLRSLAHLLSVPEKLIGLHAPLQKPFVKTSGSITQTDVNPDRILDIDLLRWLYLCPDLSSLIRRNIEPRHLKTPSCQSLYQRFLDSAEDFRTLTLALEDPEEMLLLTEMAQKKFNLERRQQGVEETMLRLLERYYLAEREKIKRQTQSGKLSEEELFRLAKAFDALKSEIPHIKQ